MSLLRFILRPLVRSWPPGCEPQVCIWEVVSGSSAAFTWGFWLPGFGLFSRKSCHHMTFRWLFALIVLWLNSSILHLVAKSALGSVFLCPSPQRLISQHPSSKMWRSALYLPQRTVRIVQILMAWGEVLCPSVTHILHVVLLWSRFWYLNGFGKTE